MNFLLGVIRTAVLIRVARVDLGLDWARDVLGNAVNIMEGATCIDCDCVCQY